MTSRRQKEPIEQKMVLGFFRGLWWLIKLPFKGFTTRKKMSVVDSQYLISKQRKIRDLINSENQAELYQAVMEADKLVDWILKKRGYSGKTFADRLKNAEGDIPQNIYNDLWYGHKIRNRIAHEDREIHPRELKNAISKMLTYNG